MAVQSTCDIAHMSRIQNKPENVKIIEYRSEMHRKIDVNIAGVQGVSRICVQSVCGLISIETKYCLWRIVYKCFLPAAMERLKGKDGHVI